jgi:hypothetical protein
MATLVKEKPGIRVSYDEMEAYMLLLTPAEGEEYTISFLLQMLAEKGVTTGVDRDRLSQMISNQVYNQEVLVAKGISAVDGQDGYYEYHFNANFDKKPKVLPDGSVDFWSVHSIEQVEAGQTIAIYHPAIQGSDGISVKGRALTGKRGREQMPLKGKGFTRSEDGMSYTADIDGKIESQNDRIVILPIHEVQGNAEQAGGNIDFRGDVIIHGSVESGVSIKATGSITIDGVVEACELEAGKEIILRSGMMGGNKASVKTKGSITAKFFEFTTIDCDGDIQADVLMDCNVSCRGRVILTGARGSIIGGEVHAIRGVEVTTLGNEAEKKTAVYVGAGIEVYSRVKVLEKKIQATKDNLDKVEAGLKQFETLEQERGVSYANDPRRMSLLRVKIKDAATMANDEAELRKLRILAEGSTGACVSVLKEVYPGVVINIDEMRFTLKNVGKSIEFYKMPDKISTRPCYRGVE